MLKIAVGEAHPSGGGTYPHFTPLAHVCLHLMWGVTRTRFRKIEIINVPITWLSKKEIKTNLHKGPKTDSGEF